MQAPTSSNRRGACLPADKAPLRHHPFVCGSAALGRRFVILSLLVFAGLLLASPVTYLLLSRALNRQLDAYLVTLARAVEQRFLRGAEGAFEADGSSLEADAHAPRHFVVVGPSGGPLWSDGEDGLLLPEAAARARRTLEPVYDDAHFAADSLRIVEWPFANEEGEILVAEVGASEALTQHMLRRGILIAVGVGFVACLLLAVGSLFLAHHIFSPIARIVSQVERIGEASLAERLPARGTDDELERLITVVNHMLDRIQRAFESQRRFSSDVAHEIRSPLTALRGQIEVALRKERSAKEYRQVLDDSLEEILRIARLAENLMSLAKVDAGVLAIERVEVDLHEVVSRAMARGKPQADEKDIRMVLHGQESVVVSGE
ncbi:MAG: histidine kinase dimerization/phospho-acceptor domain-containing protein, partial [Candidatus Eisenbacteria bacterium]